MIDPVGRGPRRCGAVLDIRRPGEGPDAARLVGCHAARFISDRDQVRQGRVEHLSGIGSVRRELAPVIAIRALGHERRLRSGRREASR